MEVDASAGAAGHIPYAKVKMKALLKPTKDPLMGLSVLVPGRVDRWTDVTSGLGYSSLEEIVEAEIADVEVGEDLSAVISELLLSPSEFRFDVQPPELEVREGETGSFDVTVELFQAGTLSFAVQAIPLREDDRLLAASLVDDPEDPLDRVLLGVIVSDIYSVSMSENARVIVS